MFAVQFRVRHRHQPAAEHRGDGTGQPPPVTQVDIDVERPRGFGPQRAGLLRQQHGPVADIPGLTPPEIARRQGAAAPFGVQGALGAHAAQQVLEHPLAHGPLAERVDLDGDCVVDAVDLGGQGVLQGPEKPPDRVLEEAHQFSQGHVADGRRGQRLIGEAGAVLAVAGGGDGGALHRGVEAERLIGDERAGLHVAGVEGLQRMVDGDPVTHPGRL